MASMADITVKKYDGTTDITYSQKVASAGDRTAAVWKCTTVGSAPGHQPTLSLTTRDNGDRTARRADFRFQYPEVATAADGSLQVVNMVVASGSVVVPQGMLSVNLQEGVYQLCNLLAASLIKQSIKDGYAPT